MSRLLALVLAMALLWAAPAYAHKIKIFATAEGSRISGYVYFPGGGRAAGVEVTVTGPGGTTLGTVTTDAEGRFTFEATRRIDHTVQVDTGDGHFGAFEIPAERLPAALPGPAAAPGAIAGEFRAVSPAAEAPRGVDTATLEDTVARAVAREVNPLREQIEAYEERIRLHDILGGLGWIAGIAGLAFFVAGRRRS